MEKDIKYRFEWGYVSHPGIWACGGGRQDLPPVLVGITYQIPQKEPEYAWWCYLGPRPVFENELQPMRDDGEWYWHQCNAIPKNITNNMQRISDTKSDKPPKPFHNPATAEDYETMHDYMDKNKNK